MSVCIIYNNINRFFKQTVQFRHKIVPHLHHNIHFGHKVIVCKHNLVRSLCLVAVMLTMNTTAVAFTVVLDAGHGGKDPGALGTYSKEKNINLNVVLKLGKLIEANCPGVKVRYTRTTDKFVELAERANIANNAKADLFISVHTNSTAKGNTARGSETYSLSLDRATQNLEVVKRENSVIQYETNRLKYSNSSVENSIINEVIQSQNMRTSALFAKSIQDEYASAGRPNKGVHQAGFLVLRQTAMPSVLTELGFITTPAEEAYLNSEAGINELANSIYRAFRKYISPILMGEEEAAQEQSNSSDDANSNPRPAAPPTEPVATEHANEPSHNQKKETLPQPKTRPQQDKTTSQNNSSQQHNSRAQQQSEPANKSTSQKSPAWDGKYVFKVQICTSNRKLRPDSEQFKGLKDVESYPVMVNGRQQFVHTYGSSTSYAEIRTIRNKIKEKFSDCFIVVFKNGERISGQEASNAFKKQP